MKLIRPSKLKRQVWSGTCSHCDAEYECDREEIEDQVQTHYSIWAGVRNYEFVKIPCTECDTEKLITFRVARNRGFIRAPSPPIEACPITGLPIGDE